jgi:multiple sugar transport system ATP-binding protein
MASVRIQKLRKQFGEHAAVEDLTLAIADRSFLTLLGPSGCGKTTALNTIAGLEEVTCGDIYIDDIRVNRIPAASRDVAMVFQSYALYPHMKVRDNLAFALKIRKVPRRELLEKVEEAAQLLGLTELLDRKPRQLSGGQRQRVAIGRAIVRDPKVFLLDEPLSNLDAGLRLQMRSELKLLFTRLGATVIYVTHDQAEAMTMSDRIAVMKEGRLQQLGSPLEIYHRPANRFVAGFVGSPPMNFADAGAETSDGAVTVRTSDFGLRVADRQRPVRLPAHDGLVLGVRPEDVSLADDGEPDTISGTCMVVERLGSGTILVVRTGKHTVTVQLPGGPAVEPGENLRLRIDPAKIYLFERDSGTAIVTPGHPDGSNVCG